MILTEKILFSEEECQSIVWDKTNNTPTFKVTSTTSQIIDKSTKNNNHFVKLLELLRDSITAASLSNEDPITDILSKINILIAC
jgi:hypothetical protein